MCADCNFLIVIRERFLTATYLISFDFNKYVAPNENFFIYIPLVKGRQVAYYIPTYISIIFSEVLLKEKFIRAHNLNENCANSHNHSRKPLKWLVDLT